MLATTAPPSRAPASAPATASSSAPSTALMPCPRPWAASAIASPRSLTSCRASRQSSEPAATSAVYSPSEWPATDVTSARVAAGSVSSSAADSSSNSGCATSVGLISSAPASHASRTRSSPTSADASRAIAFPGEPASTTPAPMAGVCAVGSWGTAMTGGLYRTASRQPDRRRTSRSAPGASGGAVVAGGSGLRLLQRLLSLANGGHRAHQVRFELLHHVGGVVVGGALLVLGALLRLADDGLALDLGLARQLVGLDHALGLLRRGLGDPRRFLLGLAEQPLLLREHGSGLLDLLRHVDVDLVEEVEDLVLVDHHVVGEGHPLRPVHQVFQVVDQFDDAAVVAFGSYRLFDLFVAHCPLFSASRASLFATDSGTAKSTLPPCRATSFISEELRNTLAKLVIRKTVVTSGASLRLNSAIWNSLSKSLLARRPLTSERDPTS